MRPRLKKIKPNSQIGTEPPDFSSFAYPMFLLKLALLVGRFSDFSLRCSPFQIFYLGGGAARNLSSDAFTSIALYPVFDRARALGSFL